MRVLIMAGGTGGHIFPALAVATELQHTGHTVAWLGSEYGMEKDLLAKSNIPLHLIAVRGLRGKGVGKLLTAPVQVIKAIWQAQKIIRSVQPDVVLGMGGYVTGPGGLAAWLLRYKLIIHEQNSVAGLTNRILARFAHKVLTAFPNCFNTNVRTILTGNPVRKEFTTIPNPTERFTATIIAKKKTLKLLILGGSNGAAAINKLIPQVAKKWRANMQLEILHQTGVRDLANTHNDYAGIPADMQVSVTAFIDDMAAAYAWADIVICRAGALTIAELAAAGVGSILIPFPYAVDDHQTSNAKFLSNNGAAILVAEKDLSVDKLYLLLSNFVHNPAKLQQMASSARSLATTNALDAVIANLQS